MLRRSRSNELFIAVVGPVGAGAGTAASAIKRFLEQEQVGGANYEVHTIKASDRIKSWAEQHGKDLPPLGRKSLDGITTMQNLGDEIRRATGDNAAVARLAIGRISEVRAEASAQERGEVDGRPRAYVVDSLRHPAEVHLLRRLYQDAFFLVGVVCDPEAREYRIKTGLFEPKERFKTETTKAISDFMERDADAPEKNGQHVIDTFHEADFFVDNSVHAEDVDETAMNEHLLRLVGLMTSREIVRPNVPETAMHHAHSAKLQSACLSRQVGSALVDARGNVVATGTNEVPKAGGGVYGETFEDVRKHDERCAFRETRLCSSNVEQNLIIEDLIAAYPQLAVGRERAEVVAELRRTRIGGLIEFSRAVHAEMDAILSAARTGVSPRGCRLFVSTFPCHYCARHIVAAGIDEVQYIEPYPKSRALKLHSDSITTSAKGWQAPSEPPSKPDAPPAKVLFRPFVGVAPRMYAKVFLKDRDYKDKTTGVFALGTPDWGGPSDLFKLRYQELEAELGTIPQ